jgi:hypothetical protein
MRKLLGSAFVSDPSRLPSLIGTSSARLKLRPPKERRGRKRKGLTPRRGELQGEGGVPQEGTMYRAPTRGGDSGTAKRQRGPSPAAGSG